MTARGHPAPPTLLYDEKCSVCRRFVSLLVRADRRGGVRAEHPELSARDSAIWVPADGPVVAHSDAILAALSHAGGIGRAMSRLGRLCPSSIRDRAYRAFARNRRWFGWLGLAELDERSRQRQRDNHPGEHQ